MVKEPGVLPLVARRAQPLTGPVMLLVPSRTKSEPAPRLYLTAVPLIPERLVATGVGPPVATFRKPVPVKAAFSWRAPEPILPQVPWAIEVAPKFRALMVCVPEKLRFTAPAAG